MLTHYVAGAANSRYNNTLLRRLSFRDWSGLGQTRLFGFRNEDGRIYQVVSTRGELDYRSLVSLVETLGLIDELQFGNAEPSNYDSVFRMSV